MWTISRFVALLTGHGSVVVLLRRVGDSQARGWRRILLALLLQRSRARETLVNDAVVYIDAKVVQRLCVAFAG